MTMNGQDRIQVLLGAAEERYKSIHVIRERVYNTCTWTLGIFLLVAGWMVQAGISLTRFRKVSLCGALLAAVITVRAVYLRDIEEGFKGQLRVAAKIEEALGLYELGVYPEDWKKAGTKEGKGSFFKASYWLIYVATAILTMAIILS